MARTILHVDLDAFYASVEQRDDPSLRGRPLVVGGSVERGVVSAASYEARPFGIRSAMPMAEALRRCPDLVVVPGRMAHYVSVSREIRAIFRRFTPLVEPLSLDEAFLDVTGSRRLFGDGPTIAEAIRRAIRAELALTASAGVAANKLIAKTASDVNKPDGLTVVPAGDEARFLAPMPIRTLWGVGPKSAARMKRRGIETIGDLQARWPTGTGAPLTARPDREMVAGFPVELFQRAFGLDDRPVTPRRDAKSISSEHTFATDHVVDDEVRSRLRDQAEVVAGRLRRARRHAKTVTLKIRTDERQADGRYRPITRSRTLAAPTDDGALLYRTAGALLDAIRLGRARIRLIGIAATGLTAERQRGLFDPPEPAETPDAADAISPGTDAPADAPTDAPDETAALNRAVDRIADRFGPGVVVPGSTLGRATSHHPATNADDLAAAADDDGDTPG